MFIQGRGNQNFSLDDGRMGRSRGIQARKNLATNFNKMVVKQSPKSNYGSKTAVKTGQQGDRSSPDFTPSLHCIFDGEGKVRSTGEKKKREVGQGWRRQCGGKN